MPPFKTKKPVAKQKLFATGRAYKETLLSHQALRLCLSTDLLKNYIIRCTIDIIVPLDRKVNSFYGKNNRQGKYFPKMSDRAVWCLLLRALLMQIHGVVGVMEDVAKGSVDLRIVNRDAACQ